MWLLITILVGLLAHFLGYKWAQRHCKETVDYQRERIRHVERDLRTVNYLYDAARGEIRRLKADCLKWELLDNVPLKIEEDDEDKRESFTNA